MKIKKVKNIFQKAPPSKFSNEWETSPYMFKQVCLHLICGTRGSGKSYTASKILRGAIDENLYDRMVNSSDDTEFSDEELHGMESLFIDEEFTKPEWKRKIIRRPQIVLVMDDILSTPAITSSSGINRLFATNRHLGELKRGGALGLSVMILTQTYATTNSHGIGRSIREQLTELTLFANKQPKQLDKIIDELGGAVDETKFRAAYEYAIQDEFDNLTISFGPKCKTMTFRRNLSEFIVFDDDEKECHCEGKLKLK